MEDRAEAWFRRRTSHWTDWPLDQLALWKDSQGARISVVIPARDEEPTVGSVVEAIAGAFMREHTLVDELVVMDSDSTDGTAVSAARAGATVYRCRDVAADLGAYPGKGEALWKSLLVTTGDILLFVDADLTQWGPHFVTGLLGPLLDPAQETLLVKACYDRVGDGLAGGGRVTELVARPLLAALRPELGCVLQPLGGEYAATRELLTSVPFAPGYGVEIGLLVDTYDRLGLDAIAQVNLGVRAHRNRPLAELGPMSRQVVATLLSRCGIPDSGVGLTQFFVDGDGYTPRTSTVSLADRPPMNALRPR